MANQPRFFLHVFAAAAIGGGIILRGPAYLSPAAARFRPRSGARRRRFFLAVAVAKLSLTFPPIKLLSRLILNYITTNAVKSELQIFQEYIRQRGLRRTPEREEILREIFAWHGHFDVDELYLLLKGKGSKVSKASIYRSLPLFMDCGLIREVDFRDGHWHYEHIYGHDHHNHLRCLGCGEIQEFEEPSLKALGGAVGPKV